MDIGVISVRYARALIKAALGMKLEDQVYQEMQTLFKSYIDVHHSPGQRAYGTEQEVYRSRLERG